MGEVEKLVRTIEADGLLWGACELFRPEYSAYYPVLFLLFGACVLRDLHV